jgi:aspartyl-tRNA(Asn)/glutamyl-tRNA(Gln) amidotransferase subunit A
MAELGQDVRGLRLGVPRGVFWQRLQPDVETAVESALQALADLGAEVVEAPWPEASLARAASFVVNRVEPVGVPRQGLAACPERYGEELRSRLEAAALIPAETYLRAQRARALAKRSVACLLAEHRLDALITPTLPATAAPADDLTVGYADGSREPVGLAYTRLTMPFNATGQPALSVPCGFDAAGLPIGLQISGRPFAEARICRIGAAYEAAAGWAGRWPAAVE